MKPQAPSTMPLFERAEYFPESLDRETVADAMAELHAWRDILGRADFADTPDDVKALIDDLEANQANPDHADYDDLQSFFDDIFQTWQDCLANGQWHDPFASDNGLRSAIIDDMQAGADAISAIEQFLATDDREALVEFFNGLKGR